MHFEHSETSLTVLLDDPSRRNPHRYDLTSLAALPRNEVKRLLDATKRFVETRLYGTQLAYFRSAVSRFGQYVGARGRNNFPCTFNEWQFLCLDWYAWYLSHGGSEASITGRVRQWNNFVVPWLNALIDEGAIPIGLIIPNAKFGDEVISPSSPRKPDLIGEKPARESPVERPINKTIAGPIFWRTDIEYLNEIETTLRQRNHLIAQVTDDYWLRLVKDCRQGRRFMRRISDQVLHDRFDSNNWRLRVPADFPSRPTVYRKVADPRVPDSEAWALRVMDHILRASNDDKCFAVENLQQCRAFQSRFLHRKAHTPINPLLATTALLPDQVALLERRSLFIRFLGILSPLDMAVAIAILIQEHPNLNPESLSEAKLLNARGKSYLMISDDGARSILSVDKLRARMRKYAALSRRAQQVVKHLIRATAPVRELLKRTGSKHWRHLFIGYSAAPWGRFGHPDIRSAQLTSDKVLSLARFYPELHVAGLIQGTFNFAKLRTTQGVLEWFYSGSIHKASKKLGNSYRVALEHYIPKPLVRLWNERIIRRFQNTLIVLAAYSEDYMVDVSDLRDYDELQAFLAQMVKENPAGHSPIGDALHQRFGATSGPIQDSTESDALLTVRLDGNALALLYAFQQITVARLSPEAMLIPDPRTGLVPKHFVDLAALLAHAAENESVGEALGESLELAKLKRAHESARAKLPSLTDKLKSINISPTWS